MNAFFCVYFCNCHLIAYYYYYFCTLLCTAFLLVVEKRKMALFCYFVCIIAFRLIFITNHSTQWRTHIRWHFHARLFHFGLACRSGKDSWKSNGQRSRALFPFRLYRAAVVFSPVSAFPVVPKFVSQIGSSVLFSSGAAEDGGKLKLHFFRWSAQYSNLCAYE